MGKSSLILGIKSAYFSIGNDVNNEGTYGVRNVGSTADGYATWRMPADFETLISLEAHLYVLATVGPVDIDLNSSYSLIGESVVLNAESDVGTTYNFTANQHEIIDASVVFNSLLANHICGLNIDNNGVGTSVKYLGISLRYL